MMCLAKQGMFTRLWFLAIILIVVFFLLFAFSSPIEAQSYIEDFEDLNLGTIDGQDGGTWIVHNPIFAAFVVTTTVYSGTQSLYFQYPFPQKYVVAQKTGLEERATGRLSFQFYPLSNEYFIIEFNTDPAVNYGDFSLRIEGGILKLRTGAASWTNLATGVILNEWNEIQIEWNVSTQKVRGKVNVSEWSEWVEDYLTNFSNIVDIGFRVRFGTAEGFIDDIQYGEEWAIMPEIDPYYPPEATTTEIATGVFNATGNYWYDPLDIEWIDFLIIFTSETEQYAFTVDISASSSDSYLAPIQIFEAGTYVVSYRFWGNSWKDCLWVPCYPQIVIFESDVTSTVVIGESGLPDWAEIPFIDFYDEDEPATGTVQHYIWSIKNFFKSLILPTQEAQSSFYNRVNTIQTKFPYNYISAIKDFMASTSEDVVNEPAIIFSLFNATGTATTSFLGGSFIMGSESKTFVEWIKLIASLSLLAGFLVYAMTFIRRIL